jgi:hypothetical protein
MLFTVVAALFYLQTFSLPIRQPNNPTSNISDMQMYDQEKVLSALKHVVGVDVDKYTVNVTHYFSEPIPRFEEEDDRYHYEREIIFNLDSEESRLSVRAVIQKKDNKLLLVSPSVLYGSQSSVHYIHRLSSDPLVATREFLSRLQAFTGNPIIGDMQSFVESAENLGAINKTVGNIKCKAMVYIEEYVDHFGITEQHDFVQIYFVQLFNGIESGNSLSVSFYDGFFFHYGDGWDLHSVANVDVNVSREQAIVIAQEATINAVGSVYLPFPSDRPAIAELSMGRVDRSYNFLFYPCWSVTVYLANPSDPWLGGWHVWLRADTGEIISMGPIHGHHDIITN